MRTTENENLSLASQITSDCFYGQQAAMYSKSRAQRFESEHNRLKFSNETEKMLTFIGRLEALQMHGRVMLAGKFNKAEFIDLLNCFQNEIFFPNKIDQMAGALMDDADRNQLLARKVAQLSHLERYALADLLELTWYGQNDESDVFEIAESLGIKFANSNNH